MSYYVDTRSKPPFPQILPCPYCGVTEDRNHNPTMHINPKLGIPNQEIGMTRLRQFIAER